QTGRKVCGSWISRYRAQTHSSPFPRLSLASAQTTFGKFHWLYYPGPDVRRTSLRLLRGCGAELRRQCSVHEELPTKAFPPKCKGTISKEYSHCRPHLEQTALMLGSSKAESQNMANGWFVRSRLRQVLTPWLAARWFSEPALSAHN